MAITGLVGVILCGIALDAIKNGKHSYDFVSKRAKQYRPFANAAEFKPHRDRWLTRVNHDDMKQMPGSCKITAYDDEGVWWQKGHETYENVFKSGHAFDDDGTPFGIEIKD